MASLFVMDTPTARFNIGLTTLEIRVLNTLVDAMSLSVENSDAEYWQS